jgi:hypothetical protein
VVRPAASAMDYPTVIALVEELEARTVKTLVEQD